MNDFLKDVIKETGNEYAGIVSEGVEAGDVENFIDTGSHIFNALFLVHFMVDFHKTKLLLWLEKVQQVKLSFSWEWLKTF